MSRKKFGFMKGKRLTAAALGGALILSAAACGKTDAPADGTAAKEWLYVPEFVTIDEEGIDYYGLQMVGDSLCNISWEWDEENGSTQSICRYSLTDRTFSKTPIVWPEGDENAGRNLNRGCFTEDGSMYGVAYSYSEDGVSSSFLIKIDGQGQLVFSADITEQLADSYADTLVADGEGRLYLTGDGEVFLFDAEGKFAGRIALDSGGGNVWIDNIACGRDGKVYLSYRDYGSSSASYVLTEVDWTGKKLGEPKEGFARANGFGAGRTYDFLYHDGTSVYAYDLAKGESELLFTWLDSDINGNNVCTLGELEDGRILAVIEDWETNDSGLALLTKTKAEEVPQKEIITVGTISGAYNLQSCAVRFNKASDKYHITIKQYLDYNNWTENSFSDALTALNNDITSDNCPDIIDLQNLNIKQLASKGVFEDLNGYLDKGNLKRADLLENILDAYTYDGTLVCIPSNFILSTVIGKADMIGKEGGWTVDELIAFADEHPEAELFDRMAKQQIMQIVMAFNEDAFIDWSAGKCSFDTDGFKKVLEFVNRFPDDWNWEEGQASTPSRIQNGEVLLDTASFYDFREVQMYEEIFQGDPVCIGYPTMDGTGGHAIYANYSYGIASKSANKDGAWEFIESILTEEDNGRYWNGFPVVKSKLDAMVENATKVEYLTDENGEIVKDEEGNPIEMGGTSSIGYEDGWSYTYHRPRQEEVDMVLALMEQARPISYGGGNDEVINIINEEAEPFYKGQKSVDEVAAIIQSRVSMYVSENN